MPLLMQSCGPVEVSHGKIQVRHLVIINVSNGNLLRNKVADFTNRRAALDSYYMRLRAMRTNVYMKRPEENSDNELPF